MIRPVISEGFLFTYAPRGCSALACIFETDYMVNINEVTGLVSVEAYGGIGFVAMTVEFFAVVALAEG